MFHNIISALLLWTIIWIIGFSTTSGLWTPPMMFRSLRIALNGLPSIHLRRIPEPGRKIKLTWLPNPRNNPSEINCYIGMSGYAEDISPDGSFCLKCVREDETEYHATLIVGDHDYKFEYCD